MSTEQQAPANTFPDDDPKTAQVRAQCRVVAHLAGLISRVNSDYAGFPSSFLADISDIVGERTAWLMENLGAIANGMDIISEDEAWTDQVFERAQEMFPRPSDPALLDAAARAIDDGRLFDLYRNRGVDLATAQAEIKRLKTDKAKLAGALKALCAEVGMRDDTRALEIVDGIASEALATAKED